MSRTITVEADVNAIDTRTLLTAQGSVTTPSLVVPSGMKKIKKIIAAIATDELADDGQYIAFLRLGGAAGGGNQLPQTGSDVAPSIGLPYVIADVDIDVSPSDTITIAVEIAGVDPGDTTAVVTLVYGK